MEGAGGDFRSGDWRYDSYARVRLIGEGGSSRVYEVERDGYRYAMKILDSGLYADDSGDATIDASDADSMAKFRNELRAWEDLTGRASEAVVHLKAYGYDGFPWMVMDLADGDYASAIAEGKAKVSDIVDLLGLLQMIHDAGYIHRDIKPENILMVDGRWRFSDFGLSKPRRAKTVSTGPRGTFRYMAPEQFDSKKGTSVATDVWQMGVVAFLVLAGRHPFDAEDDAQLMYQICLQDPDFGAVPEAYRPVIRRALSREQSARYATAREFAEALEASGKPTKTKEPEARAVKEPEAKAEPVRRSSDLPQPPSNVRGSMEGGTYRMKFEPPADSAGVSYRIFRAEGRRPAPSEADRLADVQAPWYADRTVRAGRTYHYAVYSCRRGRLSEEPARLGPVTMVPEVDVVTITPVVGGLRISFEVPKGASRVRVWREDGPDSRELSVRGNHVDDLGLREDTEYRYRVAAEYRIGGKTVRSRGSVHRARTASDNVPTDEWGVPVRAGRFGPRGPHGPYRGPWQPAYTGRPISAHGRQDPGEGGLEHRQEVRPRGGRLVPRRDCHHRGHGLRHRLPRGQDREGQGGHGEGRLVLRPGGLHPVGGPRLRFHGRQPGQRRARRLHGHVRVPRRAEATVPERRASAPVFRAHTVKIPSAPCPRRYKWSTRKPFRQRRRSTGSSSGPSSRGSRGSRRRATGSTSPSSTSS